MSERAGYRVDLHVKVLNEQVVSRAKARGLDALVYAPHFAHLSDIERRAAAFSDDELLVIPGREVFTGTWQNRKHLLAFGLDEPVPDFITLAGAMDELDRQNAAVLVPHPGFLNVGLSERDVQEFSDSIHTVETYNLKHFFEYNRKAREIAQRTEMPAFTSSYAHLSGTVGEAWTAFEEEFSTAEELIRAIRSGAPRRVEHRHGIMHNVRRKAELTHLGWENTWGKIDRILLSGMEPTHPDHIAYDGRFNDVSVY